MGNGVCRKEITGRDILRRHRRPRAPGRYQYILENLPTNAPLDQNYATLAQFTGNPGWDPLPVLRELNLPAIWLLGTDDRLVPTRECVRLVESLRQQGHRYRFITYPGFGHNLSGSGVLYWPDVFAWMTQERIR